MYAALRSIWQCMLSPQLYMSYSETAIYQPPLLELIGNSIFVLVKKIITYSIYTTPVLYVGLFKLDYTIYESSVTLIKYFAYLGAILPIAVCLRGCGRLSSPSYMRFAKTYQELSNKQSEGYRYYDFDFSFWPESFSLKSSTPVNSTSNIPRNNTGFLLSMASSVVANTFGIRAVYPGSLYLINYLLFSNLVDRRKALVMEYGGKRHKLTTVLADSVDAMFIDNRNSGGKGKTLVICCEGNSGFYEIGIMETVIKASYSALGWNHPGFGGSTGQPFPDREKNAIDAVMQFAIQKLGFKPEDIILFGWSIGGYTATWAALNYPDIKYLVLDATFDDLLPLARALMLPALGPLVNAVIRDHINLDISAQLAEYKGPVLLIRRTKDEILSMREGTALVNRSNYVLVNLVKARHSSVIGPEQEQLMLDILQQEGSQRRQYEEKVISNDKRNKDVVDLMHKYMKDYESTHCTVLPPDYFEIK